MLSTSGCATADLIEAPRRSTSLEEVLADEQKDGACFKFEAQISAAHDTQRPIWQETIANHLKRCGGELTLHYLRTLVREPTVPANDNARDNLKEFFLEFATRQNLSFTEIGQDDLWLLERGSGPEFIDFVAMLDVQPSPREMPINLRTTVPAFDLSIELDRVYGRGVEDNKAAIAAVLTLFHAMRSIPDSATKRIRLIIPTKAKSDLSAIRAWSRSHPRAPALFMLNSRFPVTSRVFGAGDLLLTLPREVTNRFSSSPWRLETLGGGNSATSTPAEALMILKFRGNDPSAFDAELQALGEIAEEKLREFPQGLSLDIRALEEGNRAWVMIRGQSRNFAEASTLPNPLTYLGALVEDVDTVIDHGRAALDLLRWLPSQGIESALSPVMLRLNQEEAVLRIRQLHLPSRTSIEADAEATLFLKAVQDTLWRTARWKAKPNFEAGYEVPVETRALRAARQIFSKFFGQTSLPDSTDRDGTFARTLPGAIGFGPLLPDAKRTSSTYTESISRQVTDRWAEMLFELVVEISATDGTQLSE
ncbi:MAG: hypothetical protein VX210_03570 [Myxococcota bacterium]|nr:hypothetical protein [Myxococcota bacterium]